MIFKFITLKLYHMSFYKSFATGQKSDLLRKQCRKPRRTLHKSELLSLPEYHLYIQRLFNRGKSVKLSRPALETLAIIAYKQPLLRLEIESIRGVECSGVIKTLIEKELVTIKGRDGGMGRALLYGTTQRFLELFGLNHLSDLPKLKEIELLMNNGEIAVEKSVETK